MAIASITFYSCKKQPFDDVAVIAKSSFTSDAYIGVQFVDAVSGENVGFTDASQKVSTRIIGVDAAKIVTVANDLDFTVDKGFLNLALVEGVNATDTNPVKFIITASASGYLTTSVPVTMGEGDGTNIIVRMVAIADAPTGIAVKTDKTSLDAGEASSATGTTTAISISSGAATGGSDATTATINIPAGQKFYTETTNGTRVTEAIEVTFAKFSATEQESLESFPGGLQASFSDGSRGQFITAGLVSIEMKTASGKEVTSFEKPIQITTGIPSGITKFDGTAIVEGDTIPVWSHNQTTGNWTYEGNCTVTDNGGQLETTYNITHLSSWNIDYARGYDCREGATINFTGNGMYGYALLTDENGTYVKSNDNLYCQSGYSLRLIEAIDRNLRLQIFKSRTDNTLLGESSLFNACTGSPTVNINAGAVNPTITVSVFATCGGGSTKYRPSFPIYAQDLSAGSSSAKEFIGFMLFGNFSSNKLIQNHTYRVFANYKGDTRVKDITVSGTAFDVDLDLSDEACKTFGVN